MMERKAFSVTQVKLAARFIVFRPLCVAAVADGTAFLTPLLMEVTCSLLS